MLKRFKNLFSKSDAVLKPSPNGLVIDEDGLVFFGGMPYPQKGNIQQGIPFAGVEDVYRSKVVQDEVKKLFQGMVLSHQQFEDIVVPVIKNLISVVHFFPASERHHHSSPMGLLVHSLQVAVFALTIARSRVFNTGATPREKRDNEERWQAAAMLAGLLHDVGKPYTDFTVLDDKNNQWDCADPVSVWLTENQASLYFIRWRRNRHKSHEEIATLLYGVVVTPAMTKYLLTHTIDIQHELARALSNYNSSGQLAEIMRKADHASVRMDLADHTPNKSEGTGVPPAQYVFKTIKSLMDSEKWKINSTGQAGIIWNIRDQGVFIDLERGVAALNAEVRRLGYVGVPQRLGSILEELSDRGYIEPYTNKNGDEFLHWEFEVMPPKGRLQTITAFKLLHSSYIFDDVPPAPIQATIVEQVYAGTKDDEPEQGNKPKAAKPASKKSNATDDGSIIPGDGSDTAKVRDFDGLMGDLKDVEGKHQPALAEQEAEKEKEQSQPEQQAPADPAAELSRRLSEQLAQRQSNGTTDPGADVKEESTASSEAGSDKSSAADSVDTAAVPTTPKQIDFGPSADKQTSTNVTDKPSTLQFGPGATPAASGAPTSSASSKPKAGGGKSRRKRKLSVREEVELESALIKREQKLEERRNSPLNFSPEASQARLAESGVATEAGKPAAISLVRPGKFEPIKLPAKTDKLPPRKSTGLGPAHEQSPISEHIRNSPPLAKLHPEPESRRPKINIENEQKAEILKARLAAESKPVQIRLGELLTGIDSSVVQQLASVIEKVTGRDVPLGVSIEVTSKSTRVLPAVLTDEAAQALCESSGVDIDTDGALVVTGNLHDCIASIIRNAERQALQEQDSDTVTENVTQRDHDPKTIEAEYTKPTASDAVTLFLEQMKLGYGNLVEPGYHIAGTKARVCSKQTMALFQARWPHISNRSIRAGLLQAGAPVTGRIISFDIGKS